MFLCVLIVLGQRNCIQKFLILGRLRFCRLLIWRIWLRFWNSFLRCILPCDRPITLILIADIWAIFHLRLGLIYLIYRAFPLGLYRPLGRNCMFTWRGMCWIFWNQILYHRKNSLGLNWNLGIIFLLYFTYYILIIIFYFIIISLLYCY